MKTLLTLLLATTLFVSSVFAAVCGVNGKTYDIAPVNLAIAYNGSCYPHNIELPEHTKDQRASKIDGIFVSYVTDQKLSAQGVTLAQKLNQAIADITHTHLKVHMWELSITKNWEQLSYELAVYEFLGEYITRTYLDARNYQ